MAKKIVKYDISYKSLLETFQKKPAPNNILLSVKEKVLIDEMIRVIYQKFLSKESASSNDVVHFNADDRNIEAVINECSNLGLFSERKIVVLRNVKKLLKDAKLSLLDYLKKPNPDVCLVMIASGEDFEPDKIFLYDAKAATDTASENKRIIEANVDIFYISEFSEEELIRWTEEKFDGYKITKDTIKHFLQFSNFSFDEIQSEIEKLKTFCFFTKEITNDSVNICNGIAREFSESDFISAILKRNIEHAIRIYSQISLKKDVEIFLLFLLNSAFIIVYKLFDPEVARLQGFNLKRELKLWFDDQERMLPAYKSYRDSIDADKIIVIFDILYKADKNFKSSGSDRQTTMISLINKICNL
ncbi:MAG: DNA polymerase III subunit delta [bacterium]|nr:DNA polymerase III subunit delta [bacterium]